MGYQFTPKFAVSTSTGGTTSAASHPARSPQCRLEGYYRSCAGRLTNMEPYSSLNNTEDRDDEPYYHTLVCKPEDIICPGSDEEETAEETRRKRLRYEVQARRYMRGHRPVLLTASLRGPFSKESGWVNPWACPSRRKRNRIRPQLATEVVASTRSQLAEKASSSHSFGYVNPEAVLAWQAKVGALESGLDEEGHTRGQDEPIISTPCGENIEISGAADSEARPDDSMRNHCTKTPHVGKDEDLTTRITKRAADSQWLKGSYVSKRARWDEPALSSPTPGPEFLGLRGRERRHTSARLPEHGNINVDRPKSATFVLGSGLEKPRETPVIENTLRDNTLFSVQIETHRNSYPATKGTLLSSSVKMTSLQLPVEDEEIDELQDNSQESRTSSRKLPGKKSRRSLNISLDPSSSDLEQDDLIVITPHSKPVSTPVISRTNSHGDSGSLTLPKLPRSSAHIASDFGEDTFVSEVAPSSRNLEKFHFKKRKRHTKSAEHGELGGGQGEALVSAQEEDPPKDDDSAPSIVSVPLQITSIEASENNIPEIGVAGEDAYSPSTKSISAHRNSPRPKSHSDIEKATNEMGIQLGNALESLLYTQYNTTPPSEPQRHRMSDGGPSLDNGEADINFDIGEMSFLRAVLRAGDSRSNTPFNKTDLTPKPTDTPTIFLNLLNKENRQHSNGFSKSVSNDPQEPAPSPSHRRIPQVSLSSQGAVSSRDSDEEEGQQPAHFSACRHRISQQHPSSSSSQKISQVLSPSQKYKSSQDRQQSAHSSKSSPQHPALSSPHSRLTQRAIPSQGSRISQDPNDISTQSYNTTPVKSQRSVPRPQTVEIVESPSMKDEGASLVGDGPITDAEQDEMDRIQLELSQVCPSSTPESAGRSGDDDDLDRIGQANVELRNTNPSANPRIQDPCRMSIEQIKHPRGGLESELEEEIVLPGGEELITGTETGEAKPEQTKETSPDLVTEDGVGGNDAHAEANETDQKINERDKGVEEASEASWGGCGPQSPWAIEHISPIPLHGPRDADLARPFGSLDPEEEPVTVDDDALEEAHDPDTSSEWQHVERPQTPDDTDITPFRDLLAPTNAPKRTEVDVSETLTSTQLLIHAATSNPWGSSLKKPSSMKTKKQTGKHVSFDGSSSQHSRDEPPLQVKFGPVFPPPPTMVEEEGMFSNGTTNGTKFEKHFSRQFTRILPENVASPLNSSPALGAQAEAFIAADRETSIDQLPNTVLQSPTRPRKPRSEPNSDIVWKFQEKTDILRSEESQPVRKSLAGFDMEDALGEMGNFLEDWSVDAELKQARVSSPEKREESNGYRRRKLFGIA
ncbi:hypothetical protein BDZ45DRAFT_493652 [Acephala macrosclerotiorum]|nr:hypothetical protein BDZ45DRAFT_493652 [Acephala macrosclerotiorum]